MHRSNSRCRWRMCIGRWGFETISHGWSVEVDGDPDRTCTRRGSRADRAQCNLPQIALSAYAIQKLCYSPHHVRCAAVLARGGSGEIGGDTDERGGIRLPTAPVGRHGDKLKAPVSGDELKAPESGDELKAPESGDERAGESPDRQRGCKPPRRRRRAPLFSADECVDARVCSARGRKSIRRQIIAIMHAARYHSAGGGGMTIRITGLKPGPLVSRRRGS